MAEIAQNSILRISDEKTNKLIDLYQKEECLWNTGIQEYKIKTIRHQAAQRIAEALNVKHFTNRHVIIKFKNLRNSYCQELKKIATSVKAGDDPVYCPRVFWFAKMDSFLRPHLQTTKEPKLVLSHEVYIKPEPDEEEQTGLEATSLSDDGDNSQDYEPPTKCPRNSFGTSNCNTTCGIPVESLENVLQNISSHLQNMTSKNSDDCFDTFGKYVAAMMRTMPIHKALELQPQIVTLLVSGAMNESGISQSDDKLF